MKNTSISLGSYFDQFVSSQISVGRYKNVSEVIRAGLRLLENEESKAITLKNTTQEGLNSPIIENYDFDENFDVSSKISYSKEFKVKAKIKTISKFTPKIIIG